MAVPVSRLTILWYNLKCLDWHTLKEFFLKPWYGRLRRAIDPTYGQECLPRPPPGRIPRPRRLSICQESRERRYSTQDECVLFSKLPLELRQHVYRFVLGNRLIHLGLYHFIDFLDTPEGPKFPDVEFRRYFCREHNDVDAWNHPCWYPVGIRTRPKDPEEKLLSLLLVCHRVYCEAINILYSTNTFDFREEDTFRQLSDIILQPRIQAISSLKLFIELGSWPAYCPLAKERWDTTWQQILSMPGLRELRVYVRSLCTERNWKENQDALLQPIRDAQPLERFEIFLPVKKEWLRPRVESGPGDLRSWDELRVLDNAH